MNSKGRFTLEGWTGELNMSSLKIDSSFNEDSLIIDGVKFNHLNGHFTIGDLENRYFKYVPESKKFWTSLEKGSPHVCGEVVLDVEKFQNYIKNLASIEAGKVRVKGNHALNRILPFGMSVGLGVLLLETPKWDKLDDSPMDEEYGLSVLVTQSYEKYGCIAIPFENLYGISNPYKEIYKVNIGVLTEEIKKIKDLLKV